MTDFIALRDTSVEERYIPAFFQRGTKVLNPVHGYGYCTKATKDEAQQTKTIHLKHLNVERMFTVGQRVGVVVNDIDTAAGAIANHWSDGIISAVDENGHYINVLVDRPIGIKWGGEDRISFLSDAGETDTSYAHLWQTVDGKSYITALDDDITDPDSTAVYNPSDIINSQSHLLVDTLDKYIPSSLDGFRSRRWFVIKQENDDSLAGNYSQAVAAEIVTYTPAGAEVEDSGYFDAVSPMFWDRLGHTDGSVLVIAGEATTWFKDKPFLFTIRGEEIPADPEHQLPKTYQPATVVYICNPFNVDRPALPEQGQPLAPTYKPFVLAVPSYVLTQQVTPIPLPIDTNLWCDGLIDGSPNFKCDFRCEIDDSGMPYVKNVGNDATIDASGDEIYCVYESAACVDEKFKNCTFDVFLRSPDAEQDLYIGGQRTNDRFFCDVGITLKTLPEAYFYASGDGTNTLIEKATYPVLLSKVNMISAPGANQFSQSAGDWSDAEYFNGKFWFASGNVLKPTNALLEFDPEDTVEIPASILGLKALSNQMFVMSSIGIYTVNLDNQVQMLSNTVPKSWQTVGESLYIVDNQGRIYNTEFTPIPAQDQRKITQNPYMVLEENTMMIQNIVDEWTVFDIASGHGCLWVASSHGLWLFNPANKTWYRASNDVYFRLITLFDEVYAISGSVNSAAERYGMDTIGLLDLDKTLAQ